MQDGDPTYNRIVPEGIEFPQHVISNDVIVAALEACEDSPGCKELIALMARSFFTHLPSDTTPTIMGFRSHIYNTLTSMSWLRVMHIDSLDKNDEDWKSKSDEYTAELIKKKLGEDLDFDTYLFILEILEHNNWADFERVFSQIRPVPLSSETSEESVLSKIENVLSYIDSCVTQLALRPPEERWNMMVSYGSLEVMLRKLKIRPEVSLFILATLKESLEITSGSEILLDTLQSLAIEKLSRIYRYIQELQKIITKKGITIDRKIMRMILSTSFNKYLPGDVRKDPRYGALVKLINSQDNIEHTFTRIRGQYKLREHLDETQEMKPIRIDLNEYEVEERREQ